MMNRQVLMDRLQITEPIAIETFSTIDSTNSEAKRRIADGLVDEVTVLVADEQTAGYGRQGRQYFSPQNHGIYLTIIQPVTDLAKVTPGRITTSVAVGAAMALEETLGVRVGIKWVNDLYFQKRKVAGILVEAQTGPNGHYLVIGIGVNVTASQYPAGLAQKAGALVSGEVDREAIAAALISHLVEKIRHSDENTIAQYRALSLVIGQAVTVEMSRRLIDGVAVDVNQDGALIVQTTEDQVVVQSGEVIKVHLTDWEIS